MPCTDRTKQTQNLSSKFISMSISHLVANDPEIPVSNIIQEVQVLYQIGLCRENGSRTDAYVTEIYSRQTYRKTYQANFYPVLSENFWRDVPFNLTFYPPNMKKERGRKQGKRFQGEMDYRNLDSPQDVVDVACRDIIGKIVITPDRAMYKFDIFLK
ncbi:hypothetical protein M9H77_01812 [Catharanthus roseus]|uniref:Uncharacterized protein n=1 Tax=Catharanthus roseus TaxID=4058 RepID=A0ACC0C6L0_CATRO|nr:hypothetical protein M9H77_01812 [Catharanthus roseus]